MWVFIKNLIIAVLLSVLGLFILKKVDPFLKGLEGEADISSELKKLPPEYTFFSDIETDQKMGNIDKVLIGPSGVWVIEAKNMFGKFTSDGNRLLQNGHVMEKDILNQVWAENYAVRDLIKSKTGIDITPQPVIVFSSPHASLHFGFNKVKGVYVIGKKWINDLITQHLTTKLDSVNVEKLKAVFS
jgi:hypothetical protein